MEPHLDAREQLAGRGESASLLLTPAFLVPLFLLVTNDFVLKRLSPGVVTGKLSDFAGLFAITFFCCVVLRRAPALAGLSSVSIAMTFVWWKSPASGFLIEAWNQRMPLAIGRTEDATDLLALVTVPIAVWAARRSAHRPGGHSADGSVLRPAVARALRFVVGCLALVAFVATSVERPPVAFDPSAIQRGYAFDGTRETLLSKAAGLGMEVTIASIPTSTTVPEGYAMVFDAPGCEAGFTAVLQVVTQPDEHVTVWLQQLHSNCGNEPVRSADAFDCHAAAPLGLRRLPPG
jgi:hypothetical protein